MHRSMHLCNHVYRHLTMHLFIHPSIYPSIYPHIYLLTRSYHILCSVCFVFFFLIIKFNDKYIPNCWPQKSHGLMDNSLFYNIQRTRTPPSVTFTALSSDAEPAESFTQLWASCNHTVMTLCGVWQQSSPLSSDNSQDKACESSIKPD